MPRKPNPPRPDQHPTVLHKIVAQVANQDKTIIITKVEGLPMTWKQANSYKQQFLRFRGALRGAVASGDLKWEKLLAEAASVGIHVEKIPPDGMGSISFYNRERTTFARTMEEALVQGEAL